jgi:aldehyde:ferredoxin oxidoreductase
VDDPEAVLRAAAACDAAGLDTISTGGTIAFLMECVERDWVDGRLGRSGRSLRFGDGAALLDAIAALIDRDGPLGELLALGSRRAAARIGGEAPALAPHVKGLELPGYHPRTLHAMALGLAVGTRGADHNRSGAYEADFAAHPRDDAALAALATEDRSALMDSLILCKFLRGVFTDLYAESAAMLGAVTGWDVINQREGWTRTEDTPPPRLLTDEPTAGNRNSLTRARLDALISAYYHARGWTADGRVPQELRFALGLDDPAFGPLGAADASTDVL